MLSPRPARRLVFLACLALLGVSAACGGDSDGGSDGRYEDDDLGISFEYPKEWEDLGSRERTTQFQFGEQNIIGVATVGHADNATTFLTGLAVTVTRLNVSINDELRAVAFRELEDAYRRQPGIQVAVLAPSKLADADARTYSLRFRYQGAFEAINVQTVAFIDDRQYTVNCQAKPDEYDRLVRAGCEQALRTLRLK